VWLAAYRKAWAFDVTAHAIVEHLSDQFEIRIAYDDDVKGGAIDKWPSNLILDMWWAGDLARRYRGSKCVKQITSHRWQLDKWGKINPCDLIKRYASCDGAILVPSYRLLHAVNKGRYIGAPQVHRAPKGFDPSAFGDFDLRGGDLAVGWAGKVAVDKGVGMLVKACPDIRLADQCLTMSEMPDFYNGIDVIAIASVAEGDPRPLIEGMACGCFVVATDVGIVPELVVHGVNGLIVQPTSEAFEVAFAWCRANIEFVREAGRRNAVAMKRSRTWAHVMPIWGSLFASYAR
jgi:hypothetical protein